MAGHGPLLNPDLEAGSEDWGMGDEEERYRLVVLGSSCVGKTALIHRYLNNAFSERHKETVEDVYARDFNINGEVLRLDVIDTSFVYPDMRRLTIKSASAFLLVLAVDNVVSFKHLTFRYMACRCEHNRLKASDLMKEIIASRGQETMKIPLVVVGNKCDLADIKKINRQTAEVWLMQTAAAIPRSNIIYIEASAKSGEGVVDIFRSLLEVSGFPKKRKSALTGTLSIEADVKRTRSFRSRSSVRKQEEPSSMARHGSLIRRHAQRMSFKGRQKPVEDVPKDESDCIIS